jgi:hypothetical protein
MIKTINNFLLREQDGKKREKERKMNNSKIKLVATTRLLFYDSFVK